MDMFAEKLTVVMEKRSKCAKQVAAETGLAYNTVLSYKRGDRTPTSESLYMLCKCLNVSADWLLGLEKKWR